MGVLDHRGSRFARHTSVNRMLVSWIPPTGVSRENTINNLIQGWGGASATNILWGVVQQTPDRSWGAMLLRVVPHHVLICQRRVCVARGVARRVRQRQAVLPFVTAD